MASDTSRYDAVVVGAGPNGLAAAVALAQAGRRVVVLEGHEIIGGGTRTAELTLPGFHHDVCSAIHPTAVVSPFLRTLPLADHGLRWRSFPHSVAHPISGDRAALLTGSVDDMAASLGADGDAYRRLVGPFVRRGYDLFDDVLAAPIGVPHHPLLFARFGLTGLLPASWLARRFRGEAARALLAGCAAHATLPLSFFGTGAMGLVFLVSAHVAPWPCAEGGSVAISRALASLFRSLGGEIRTGTWVRSLSDLPPHRVALFDTSPRGLDAIAGDALPDRYRRRLRRFVMGPGVFKLDFALDRPIPWSAPGVADASTVHVGGPFDEVAASERAMWDGQVHDRPFLIVCQQSRADASRAPEGKHTGYAYCHVPAGFTGDATEAITAQIERFAPGFRSTILATHVMSPADLEAHNPNLLGGVISGGAVTLWQLFARPALRLDPYSTPNPSIFLCSSSTPPGGGVHGMSGYLAARSALRRLARSV